MADPKKILDINAIPPGPKEGRLPPQATDTERSVLGAMMLENGAIATVVGILDESAFYVPGHRKIFEAITTLYNRNEPADLITVTEELRRRGWLDESGGEVYLTELTSRVSSIANVEYHAHILVEKALMRGLIATSAELSTRAYSSGEDALDLLDEAEQKIFMLSEQRMKKGYTKIGDALYKTIGKYNLMREKGSHVTGVPSDFTDLDNILSGFQPANFVVVAGRPGTGKTALVLTIARNVAVKYGIPVAYFSLEMSIDELTHRLISAEAGINSRSLISGRLPESDWKKLSMGLGKLYEAKLFIDDSPSLSILELRAKARRLKADPKTNIGLIIVDYLQLMQGPKNAQSREQEIAAISRSLKALSKELDIPVIALSQLNRGVETRGGDRRPTLADLRESGAIEQDADVVLFVYRPEMYGIETDEQGNPTEGMAEIIIGKHRNGPLDTIQLAFVKEFTKFGNLDRHRMVPLPPSPEAAPF